MKLELAVRKGVSHVELVKDDQLPLGITVRDGSHDEAGPVIKKVKPRSLAERSHAVAEGDVILALNGRDETGADRNEVRRAIKEAGPSIELKLQFQIRETCISRSGVYYKRQMSTKLHKVGDSFGFVLRKNDCRHPFTVEYPMISNIRSGGSAQNDGLMKDGDYLLKVDDVSLSWLSLNDIASILQERTEAEFTFQYNVRVVDFPPSTVRRIHLKIDVPHVDLGIGICSYPSEKRAMCIASIRMGSIAERCGIFTEGDIVLSINDIEVEYLTLSKVNSLLRSSRKRKISFISAKGKEQKSILQPKNYFCFPKEKYEDSESSIGAPATDNQHFNTPASTNSTLSVRRKSQPKEFLRREQTKAIRKFQDLLKYMTQLKQNLSQLTRDAFDNKENAHTCQENCSACNRTQHSVNLCASCLSKMNVECAQSMDHIKNIISNFIIVSLKQGYLLPSDSRTEAAIENDPVRNTVSKNLIHSLTETLPKVFADKSELNKSFQALAEKISKANTSCSTCKDEIGSASLTTQKLLLLISLNDSSTETKVLINQLVYCLLETKLSCDAATDSSDSSVQEQSITESEQDSHPPQLSTTHQTTSTPKETGQHQNSASEFHDVDLDESPIDNNEVETSSPRCSSKGSSLKVDLSQQSAHFKLIDVQSISGSEISSVKEPRGTVKIGETRSGGIFGESSSIVAAAKANITGKSPTSNKSAESNRGNDRKVYKDKGLFSAPSKIWKSLDSFLSPRKSPIRKDSRGGANACEDQNSQGGSPECSFLDPPQGLLLVPDANRDPRGNERKDSESNYESTRSSFKYPTDNHEEKVKTHTEIMEVNMSSNGGGYGFVIGFKYSKNADTLPMNIITMVKPKSPAQRSGVLAKNDRVIAINRQSLVGIPFRALEKVKKQVYNSTHVSLTIEFDVVDAEIQYGTFDILLDTTLKTGLSFVDMHGGRPLVVEGVIRGSAAHRSGQLFPRDKLILLKSWREEEYDPFSTNTISEEYLKITVQRDRPAGLIETSFVSAGPPSENPFSTNACFSSPRTGVHFIVKRSSLRSVEGTDTQVLDHEITLFRDPISWDFGFLVGENPVAGKAYVTDVRPDGPAGASGVMKKFDRIVEVNGVTVGKREDSSVLSLLTLANDRVDLITRRICHKERHLSEQPQDSPFL